LVRRLDTVPDHAHDPLAALRTLPRHGLRPETRSLVRLLTNRDPRRFDALYSAIPNRIRRTLASLSPLDGVSKLHTRVLIASAPHDKYFPPEQSRELARHAPRIQLTLTPALQHAIPHFSLDDLAGLFRFDGFLVRILHAAG
jgi:pimeloyl-ACP methyl ester carboxylesterase